MPSIPQAQKAWLVTRKGRPSESLSLDQNVPVPSKLAPGEVLIKVQAAAMNPVGYHMMGMWPNFVAKRPHVAEHDFTGIVVDANGTELQNGQAVYGVILVPLQFKTHQGALAQYTRVPASVVVPRPPGMTPTEAAGLGLAGLTAYQALFTVAKLRPGQNLFINGGSTAVGIFAIQLAKAIGCTVTASASGKREDLLHSLGVDHFIDYTKGRVHEQLERNHLNPKFDVMFEAVGVTDVELWTHSANYLAPGGTFTSVGMWPGEDGYARMFRYMWETVRPGWLGGTKRKWKLVVVSTDDRRDLDKFAQCVKDGQVKPVIDSLYSFEDVPKAYERIMSSRAAGKIIIKVDPSAE